MGRTEWYIYSCPLNFLPVARVSLLVAPFRCSEHPSLPVQDLKVPSHSLALPSRSFPLPCFPHIHSFTHLHSYLHEQEQDALWCWHLFASVGRFVDFFRFTCR